MEVVVHKRGGPARGGGAAVGARGCRAVKRRGFSFLQGGRMGKAKRGKGGNDVNKRAEDFSRRREEEFPHG